MDVVVFCFVFVLFQLILFYFILFYFILFYSILFYSTLFIFSFFYLFFITYLDNVILAEGNLAGAGVVYAGALTGTAGGLLEPVS